jgi:SAM-dependent methyltransferase
VLTRRISVLAGALADLIPRGASVLDVGCGGGRIAHEIMRRRPDVNIQGIDVLIREQTFIPVERYDGREIPHGPASFDLVLLVDMLHHTREPEAVLRESSRVTRYSLLIKDHLLNGWMAGKVLRFMDMVGNQRFGVSLPYNYWPLGRWQQAFDELGLRIGAWRGRLGLYPFPASLLFERGLHFLVRLDKRPDPASGRNGAR